MLCYPWRLQHTKGNCREDVTQQGCAPLVCCQDIALTTSTWIAAQQRGQKRAYPARSACSLVLDRAVGRRSTPVHVGRQQMLGHGGLVHLHAAAVKGHAAQTWARSALVGQHQRLKLLLGPVCKVVDVQPGSRVEASATDFTTLPLRV